MQLGSWGDVRHVKQSNSISPILISSEGIYVAGDSGGFLNPAITHVKNSSAVHSFSNKEPRFCFCLYRKLPWKRFPVYALAQFLGGFCAAGVIYAN